MGSGINKSCSDYNSVSDFIKNAKIDFNSETSCFQSHKIYSTLKTIIDNASNLSNFHRLVFERNSSSTGGDVNMYNNGVVLIPGNKDNDFMSVGDLTQASLFYYFAFGSGDFDGQFPDEVDIFNGNQPLNVDEFMNSLLSFLVVWIILDSSKRNYKSAGELPGIKHIMSLIFNAKQLNTVCKHLNFIKFPQNKTLKDCDFLISVDKFRLYRGRLISLYSERRELWSNSEIVYRIETPHYLLDENGNPEDNHTLIRCTLTPSGIYRSKTQCTIFALDKFTDAASLVNIVGKDDDDDELETSDDDSDIESGIEFGEE